MTRHGKLLTSTGGLIILPEEEFNKVRCKPRPVRATGGGARNNIDVSGLANDDETEFVVPDAIVASTSSNMTAKKSTPKKAVPKRGAKKAAAAAKVKTEEEDGSGNFEQQRQEDLIRLLYQRLTSADGGEEEESGVESGSPIPADGVVESMEIQDENGEIQVMEVNCIEETVVVESQDDVAAAVVVESIPNSVEQVIIIIKMIVLFRKLHLIFYNILGGRRAMRSCGRGELGQLRSSDCRRAEQRHLPR